MHPTTPIYPTGPTTPKPHTHTPSTLALPGPGFSGAYSIASGGLLTLDPDPWSSFGLGQLPATTSIISSSGRHLLGGLAPDKGMQQQLKGDGRQQQLQVGGEQHEAAEKLNTIVYAPPPRGPHNTGQEYKVGKQLHQSKASSGSGGPAWGGPIQGTFTAAEASTTMPTAAEDAARGDNTSWLDASGSIVVTGPVPQFLLPPDKMRSGRSAGVKAGSYVFWILVSIAVALGLAVLGLLCCLCVALARRRRRQAAQDSQQVTYSAADDSLGVLWASSGWQGNKVGGSVGGPGRVRSTAEVTGGVGSGPVLMFEPSQGRGTPGSTQHHQPNTGPRMPQLNTRRPNSSPAPGSGARGGARRVSHNSWVTPTGMHAQ
jgi:hypothetical protein